MFILRTQTRNRVSGDPYTTYRLEQSARVGGAVKQSTLLNLGSHIDLPQAEWVQLAQRIDELLRASAPCSTQRCRMGPERWRLAMRRN